MAQEATKMLCLENVQSSWWYSSPEPSTHRSSSYSRRLYRQSLSAIMNL